MKINTDNCPPTEYSEQFIQGMINRMSMSYLKYGRISDAYPSKVSALESLKLRIKKYLESGNKEHLMDAANFLMIEFICPEVEDAYFKAEDSNKSPGRVWHGEYNPSSRANNDEYDK
jgi:hypothetical protein